VACRLLALLIAFAALVAPAYATFPGRNGEILITREYESGSFAGELTLQAIHPRTGAVRTLWQCRSDYQSDLPECDRGTTPAVSPDGRTASMLILEECCVNPPWPLHWLLYTVDLQTGAARNVDFSPGDTPPTDRRGRVLRWLGDGSGLSVTLYGSPDATPFVNRKLGFDGKLGEPVGPANATSFDWAADGRAVFLRSPSLFVIQPKTSLWVLNPDGSEKRLVRNGTDPSWSPHGRWVAFTRKEQIWVVDTRTGRTRRLTTKGGERPAWSPDGRRIAFFRVRDESAYLYVLDPRGGPARRVLPGAVEYPSYSESFVTSPPEWQALPR
jgi:Tol biopolymer transport system component